MLTKSEGETLDFLKDDFNAVREFVASVSKSETRIVVVSELEDTKNLGARLSLDFGKILFDLRDSLLDEVLVSTTSDKLRELTCSISEALSLDSAFSNVRHRIATHNYILFVK